MSRRAYLPFIIPIALYIGAAIFVRYVADDYCDWMQINQVGVVGNAVNMYQTWTGRFAYSVLAGGAKLLPGGVWAGIPTFLTLLVWTVALIAAGRIIGQRLHLPAEYGSMGALLLMIAALGSAPDLFQSVTTHLGSRSRS